MTLRRGAMVAVVTLAVLTAGMPAGARAHGTGRRSTSSSVATPENPSS